MSGDNILSHKNLLNLQDTSGTEQYSTDQMDIYSPIAKLLPLVRNNGPTSHH